MLFLQDRISFESGEDTSIVKSDDITNLPKEFTGNVLKECQLESSGFQNYCEVNSIHPTAKHAVDSKIWLPGFKRTRETHPGSRAVIGSHQSTEFRRRAVLTAETAAAIFNLRNVHPTARSQPVGVPVHAHTGRSVLVSRMFGISPKAVRDIWNLRTWRHVTDALRSTSDAGVAGNGAFAAQCDEINEFSAASAVRPVGRPRGSKDSRPRRRRAVVTTAGPAAALKPVDEPRPPQPSQPVLPAMFCASSQPGPWYSNTAHWCPVGGPSSAAGRPTAQPAGAASVAAEDDPELCRSFPFFLQDPLSWV